MKLQIILSIVLAARSISAGAEDPSTSPPEKVQMVATKTMALALTYLGNPPDYEPAVCIDKSGIFLSSRHVSGPHGSLEVPLMLNPGQPNQEIVTAEVLIADWQRQRGMSLLKVKRSIPFEAAELAEMPAKSRGWHGIFVRDDEKRQPPPPYPAVILRPNWKHVSLPGDLKYGAMFDDHGRLGISTAARELLGTPRLIFRPSPILQTHFVQEHEFSIHVETVLGKPIDAKVQLKLGHDGERQAIARVDKQGRFIARTKLPAPHAGTASRERRLNPIRYVAVAELESGQTLSTEGVIEILDPGAVSCVAGLRAPAFSNEKVTIRLPAPVDKTVVGAGGRLLLLHLKKLRKVAVFDASEARVIKYLNLDDLEDPMLAAGVQKAIVVDRNTNRIIRWDLSTLERDCEAPLPISDRVSVERVILGYASDGPIGMQISPHGISPHCLIDLGTLVLIAKGPFLLPDNVTIRPADQSLRTYRILPYLFAEMERFPIPRLVGATPDDDKSYATYGLLNHKTKPPKVDFEGQHCVPSCHPSFFMVFRYGDRKAGSFRIGQPFKGFEIFTFPEQRGISARIELPEITNAGFENVRNTTQGLLLDDRIFLIPQADMLVSIPDGLDQLVVRKLDVAGLLAKSNPDFLLVDSNPPVTAYRGQTLIYEPKVRGKSGKFSLQLEMAPVGMTQTRPGRIEWAVPKDFAETKVKVSILFRDSAGPQTYQNFAIDVR